MWQYLIFDIFFLAADFKSCCDDTLASKIITN